MFIEVVIIVDYISAYIYVYVLCSCMWLYNTTALLQRSKIPTNECLGYDTKQSDGEVPVMLELGNVKHFFIAIAPVVLSAELE